MGAGVSEARGDDAVSVAASSRHCLVSPRPPPQQGSTAFYPTVASEAGGKEPSQAPSVPKSTKGSDPGGKKKRISSRDAAIAEAEQLLGKCSSEWTFLTQWESPLKPREVDGRARVLESAARKLGGLLYKTDAMDDKQMDKATNLVSDCYKFAERMKARKDCCFSIRADLATFVTTGFTAEFVKLIEEDTPGDLLISILHLEGMKLGTKVASGHPECASAFRRLLTLGGTPFPGVDFSFGFAQRLHPCLHDDICVYQGRLSTAFVERLFRITDQKLWMNICTKFFDDSRIPPKKWDFEGCSAWARDSLLSLTLLWALWKASCDPIVLRSFGFIHWLISHKCVKTKGK